MASPTFEYVIKIPIVDRFINRMHESKLKPLFHEHDMDFSFAPAAASMHHNFTHGLLIHTAEVWQCADLLYGELPDGHRITHEGDLPFTRDELFVTVALHDLAKIKQYVSASNHCWKRTKMICNQECWTLRECAKHGIDLTDNELVGLLHAEGGYTDFEVDWRPLSVIMHSADLWSSQAMRHFWDPAAECNVSCPKCKEPMALRSGKMGPFYGCSAYPSCNGIVNMDAAPDVGKVFMEFLKKHYPHSS